MLLDLVLVLLVFKITDCYINSCEMFLRIYIPCSLCFLFCFVRYNLTCFLRQLACGIINVPTKDKQKTKTNELTSSQPD